MPITLMLVLLATQSVSSQTDGIFERHNRRNLLYDLNPVLLELQLYIVDRWSHRVQKFSNDEFGGWAGKCTAGDNCDTVNQHSLGFTCTAATCSGLGLGNGDGQFYQPAGVAVDSSGNVYIEDTGNSRVQLFRRS